MSNINEKIINLEKLLYDIKIICSIKLEYSYINFENKKIEEFKHDDIDNDYDNYSLGLINNQISLGAKSETNILKIDLDVFNNCNDEKNQTGNLKHSKIRQYENTIKTQLKWPKKDSDLIKSGSLSMRINKFKGTSQITSQDNRKYFQLVNDQMSNMHKFHKQDNKKTIQNQILDEYYYFSLFNDQKDKIDYIKIKDIQIPHDSLFTLFWNCLIALILLTYIVVFPFERFSESWIADNNLQILFDLLFEQFFIIDIFLNFITSQRNNYGKIIVDTYQISNKYINSWFFIDLLSSIPTANLFQFGIITIQIDNSLLRIIKLPKYLKIFRGFRNLQENKFLTIKNILFEKMGNIGFNRIVNAVKFGLIFTQLSNILVCLLVSFANQCAPGENCYNWFYSIIDSEFYSQVYQNDSIYNKTATQFYEINSENAVSLFQNWIIEENRQQVQMDAWYFVFQTVTTVGQGDISTFSSYERLFRTLCMIIGVTIYTILSAYVMDSIISDSLDIYRKNEHVVMIEKLQLKQGIQGESRSFLGMLGDSVQTEPIQKEIEFINMLPNLMYKKVLKQIWNVQYDKLLILSEENISFFLEFMKISSFRRCITNEIVNDKNVLSMVYSGQVGVFVPNLNNQLKLEFLQQRGVGEEFGFQNLLIQETRSNFEYSCIISSEIIEINLKDQLNLISSSLKGFDYLQKRITEYFVNLQMVVSMQNAMIKLGLQIEQKWQRKIMSLMKFGFYDYEILYKIQRRFISSENDIVDLKLQKKKNMTINWYDYQLDVDSQKYILSKSKQSVEQLISSEEDLNNFKIFVKKKNLMRNQNLR